MKKKQLQKKLQLHKTTVSTLNDRQQEKVRGGYPYTQENGDCESWHPDCPTQPRYYCRPSMTNAYVACPCGK